MSAIAGLWRFDEKPGAGEECTRMLAYQRIYGPDEERVWWDASIAVGRRLFRLLPEDVFDRQPLHSADGRLILVADLRLDNREELVRELELASERAREMCDAAILLECLARWQERAIARLVGDFAFALWNTTERKLLLARDFIGQRPLYYHRGKDFFAFASMPKGLHALSEIPFAPDEQFVKESIGLLPRSGSASFFKAIDRVEPGCFVTITRDGLAVRRYWEPKRPGPRMRTDEYVEGLRHYLDQATRSRLRGADGAVGCHLSSGFDSAAVTATAARLLAPAAGKVIAFTAVPREDYDQPGPENRLADEGPLAGVTAAMYPNIEHVLLRTGHLSPLEGLDRIFYLFDSPMQNLCNWVWGRALNEAAQRRRIRIMLNGLFGNLTISYAGLELLPELVGTGHLIDLWRASSQLVANHKLRWRGAIAQAFGPYAPAWLWQWAQKATGRRRWNILNYTGIRSDLVPELHRLGRERGLDFAYRLWKGGFVMRLWIMRALDQGNHYKGILGGWGIDERDPTADKRLVDFSLAIPTAEFLSNGAPRSLARRVLGDRLPPAVLNEPKRGYQAVDWHEGLAAARASGALTAELDRIASCPSATAMLDIARLRGLVEKWPAADTWARPEVMESHRLALLRSISAGHFLRRASSGER